MGKAIPKNVKQKARELLILFPQEFTNDFAKNKQFLKYLNLPFSKTTVNLIAGFITRKEATQPNLCQFLTLSTTIFFNYF